MPAGPRRLLRSRTHGGRLIQISTDYVFASVAADPYEIDDTPRPKSA